MDCGDDAVILFYELLQKSFCRWNSFSQLLAQRCGAIAQSLESEAQTHTLSGVGSMEGALIVVILQSLHQHRVGGIVRKTEYEEGNGFPIPQPFHYLVQVSSDCFI